MLNFDSEVELHTKLSEASHRDILRLAPARTPRRELSTHCVAVGQVIQIELALQPITPEPERAGESDVKLRERIPKLGVTRNQIYRDRRHRQIPTERRPRDGGGHIVERSDLRTWHDLKCRVGDKLPRERIRT